MRAWLDGDRKGLGDALGHGPSGFCGDGLGDHLARGLPGEGWGDGFDCTNGEGWGCGLGDRSFETVAGDGG